MFPLYVDEDSMARGLLTALRQRLVDVLTVQEANMRRRADADQVTFATGADRIIYTANVRDFARIHRQLLARGGHHRGIILLTDQRSSIGEQLRGLMAILNARTAAQMADKLEFLSNWR